ncbi:MAG: PilN domain-containing protein [Thermoanaerobaculales bacterium]
MIIPNLASRPFLNTRQVWVVTAAAGLVALVLIGFNLRFYLVSNRTLGSQLERRDELRARHAELEEEVRSDVEALAKVPWRSLRSRVEATNLILSEHAFSWVRMLDDLGRVLPWDVRVTEISPKVEPEEATLSIEVLAQTRPSLMEFLDNLVEDPSFSDPTPARETTPEESAALGYLMTLRVTYRPGGETP